MMHPCTSTTRLRAPQSRQDGSDHARCIRPSSLHSIPFQLYASWNWWKCGLFTGWDKHASRGRPRAGTCLFVRQPPRLDLRQQDRLSRDVNASTTGIIICLYAMRTIVYVDIVLSHRAEHKLHHHANTSAISNAACSPPCHALTSVLC